MANKGWGATALAGGTAGALDDIKHSALTDGDIAIVDVAGTNLVYHFHYDDDNSSAESSPDVIRPDSTVADNENGRWILDEVYLDAPTIPDFTNSTHDHADAAGGGNTLVTPTIASFVNATHDHADAAGGGSLGDIGNLTSTGVLSFGADTDTENILGRVKIGYNGSEADKAVFAHYDHMSNTNYGFNQVAAGSTNVNAPTGQGINLKVNDGLIAYVNANGFTISDGLLTARSDTDTEHTIGRVKIGYNGTDADVACIAHVDRMSVTDFGFSQLANGNTSLNVPTGGTIYFRVNGSSKMTIDAAGLRGTTGARVTDFLDEDDMASNSDVVGVTQQSVKAYVDGQVAASGGLGLGVHRRPQFEWKDADEIYIYGGASNVKDKAVTWVATLTKAFAAMDGSSWYYVYLDYSALSDGGTVTATEVIYSTTAPTWNTTYSQYMNGDDRCIFAVKSTGAATIAEFWHDGDYVAMGDRATDLSLTDIDDTWTDVTLSIPGFSRGADVLVLLEYGVAPLGAATGYWRTNGSAATSGHFIGTVNSANTSENAALRVVTDTSQIVELKYSASNGCRMVLYTEGWYFPIGM
jgi:hypothetical protein